MSNNKIWVASIGENFDKSLLKRAQDYTDLPYEKAFKIILPYETDTSFYSKKIIQDMIKTMKDYEKDDYLVMSGMIILNVHAFQIVMKKFGVVNLLIFRPRKGGYDYIKVDESDYNVLNLEDIT